MPSTTTPLPRIALAALATLITLGGAAGCGTAGDGRTSDGRVAVVAAFYPLQFLAERIGADEVSVTNLVKPGAEPHDLELSPRQVAQVADAAMVVYLKGFQPALDDAVAAEAGDRSLDVSSFAPMLGASAGPNHAAEAEPDGEQESGASALNGADPHIWLDPGRMGIIAARLGARLAEVDPAHADDYRQRTLALRDELSALDTEYSKGLETCQRREIITSHAAFGYLADRYKLTQVPLSGLSPDIEPSPQRLAEVAATARAHRATTIFFETLASPKLAETLAAEVGARTAVLDPIEGLTSDSTGDYLSIMRENLAALRTALGCS